MRRLRILGLVCLLTAGGWFWQVSRHQTASSPAPQLVNVLETGVVARMDSPVFHYSPGWRVSSDGADPSEPADPWTEPSGQVVFSYQGRTLALNLAVGNYWGYIYVTVDGAPANELAVIPGNVNSVGQLAGYKPLLAPERQTDQGPAPEWVIVHRAGQEGTHRVEVEVWRSWGQIPLRAVAADGLPPEPLPIWPSVALTVAGLALLAIAGWRRLVKTTQVLEGITAQLTPGFVPALLARIPDGFSFLLMGLGLALVAAGVYASSWLLTDMGLALLAVAGLLRLELWTGALLFGLPFYLHPLPLLPGRALNLVEIGVWGGLALWVVQVAGSRQQATGQPVNQSPNLQYPIPNLQSPRYLVTLILLLALVSVFAAQERDVALREWRTLFLAAAGFALLLQGTLHRSPQPDQAWRRMLLAWLAGGAVVASIGVWQFVTGQMIIQAEGVNRVRGLYGSPNNLALYLERTLAVGLGWWMLGSRKGKLGIGDWRLGKGESGGAEGTEGTGGTKGTGGTHLVTASPRHLVMFLLVAPQLAALVLTFSKGALFLAVPAMLLTLAGAGVVYLRSRRASLRPLWGLAAVGLAIVLGLAPFLNADRFRLLFDVSQGTTGGLRVNLWRSSLAMALDHPWLGVGPDNFLYAYRSGYILPAAWQDPDLNHPHNVVLDWWTRLGVGGLLLAGLWLWGGMRRLWRWVVQPAGTTWTDGGAMAVGGLAAISAALAHGLIDASYALPDLMLVWVLLLSAGNVHDPLGENGAVEFARVHLADDAVCIDEEGGG